MEHLIVLPGNSSKNKAWGELVLQYFSAQFDSVFMLSYDHWESGEANINFEREIEKLREHIATVPLGTEIGIFAKSAGSLLAFLAIQQSVCVPKRCVFFGIPFDLAATKHFKESWEPVSAFGVPAIAFHNVEDPTASYEFTQATLSSHVPHIKLVTTHEADHWYGDMATYEQHLKSSEI